jgi:hypothetical protein
MGGFPLFLASGGKGSCDTGTMSDDSIDGKSTRAQKAYLEFRGAKVFPDDYEEAESLIDKLWIAPAPVDYKAADEALKLRIPEFRQRIRSLKKWMVKNPGKEEEELALTELEVLEEELECILGTLKDRKEDRAEDEALKREERRDYIAGLQWEMSSEGVWRDRIRKPTIAQVKECVEELERNGFDWEDEKATLLYTRLIQKFPSLKR